MGKIKFRIVKNNNEKSDQYGKFYARVQSQGTVETQELAEKIQSMCTLTVADIVACLQGLKDAMSDELGDGKTVHLDGIGYFKPAITSTPADSALKFSVQKNVKKNRVICQIERKRISGKMVPVLLTQAQFEEDNNYDSPRKMESAAAGGGEP